MSDGEKFHASGLKCMSGGGGVGSRVGKRTLGQDERQERGSCVGKRMSIEGFARQGRCVPRIVSFSATIQ